ncbi:hypothetical protein HMPREF9303_2699 [Prevotella denticola CRIS 18C-A]|uniref:Uncharacterized protein n=1 Tax=Prevotella denticola CRIS 18C-A TaxID=944557 RepID=F0H947_9BACT|nr:hypothetical protein HMPREF9303_2699 [Prevotella denticola CRIS 18C-A]
MPVDSGLSQTYEACIPVDCGGTVFCTATGGRLFSAKVLYFFCASALFRKFYLNLQRDFTYSLNV